MTPRTILVVEDEAVVALDLQERLTRLGYRVVALASDAERAIAGAHELHPDVVLMDIRLQGERDGVDAAITIHRTLDIPIVFLTAFADDVSRQRVMMDEPAGYLLKPVDARELEVVLATAIRRAESMRLARTSEKWLGSVLCSISDAVIATEEGKIHYLNPAAERLTGWKKDQAVGTRVAQVLPFFDEIVGDRRQARGPLERTLVTRNGATRAVEIELEPILDGERPGTVCVLRDVTHRRREEEKLRRSEERLRLAAAAGQVGMLDFDPISGVAIWDDRAKDLFGLPRDADVGYDVWLSGLYPDDRPRVEAAVRRAFAPGSSGVFDEEYRVTPSGERWAAVQGEVLFDDKGQPVRFVGTIRDTTEQHRVEQLRERLIGILAHDLRSPMSTITLGGHALLRECGGIPVAGRRLVEMISRSADRMSRMIEDLMDFTRVRLGGGIEPERERVDLVALTRELAAEAEIASSGQRVLCDARGECVGMWDRILIGRVLSNLIGNALRHGCPDTPVDILLDGDGAQVVLAVHNEGAPIPSDVRPFIFDPFRGERARGESGKREGLGLGLYISREIIAAHGGEIDVRSTAEDGTTFLLRLPRASLAAPH